MSIGDEKHSRIYDFGTAVLGFSNENRWKITYLLQMDLYRWPCESSWWGAPSPRLSAFPPPPYQVAGPRRAIVQAKLGVQFCYLTLPIFWLQNRKYCNMENVHKARKNKIPPNLNYLDCLLKSSSHKHINSLLKRSKRDCLLPVTSS